MIQARILEIWFEGKVLVEVTCLQSKYFKRKVDPEYFIFGHIHGQQIKASQEYQNVDKTRSLLRNLTSKGGKWRLRNSCGGQGHQDFILWLAR